VLSRGRIVLAPAPFLLLAIAALATSMGLSTEAMPIASRAVPIADFFMSSAGLWIAIEIFLYAAAAGLYVVPIFAAVQAWAGEDRRARTVAGVTSLSYIGIVAGSLATMILLQLAHLSEPMALVALGFANVVGAIYFFRRLPAGFSPSAS
jgi:acyl-[acyl-carrier-protein]-phospholipid O-acyltransferase/long-chain-fatty-acid--[acyl-carrier-protein] ligase